MMTHAPQLPSRALTCKLVRRATSASVRSVLVCLCASAVMFVTSCVLSRADHINATQVSPEMSSRLARRVTSLFIIQSAHAKRRRGSKYRKSEEVEEGGTHWRCETRRGPLHIWIPKGYNRRTAGVVFFVHGYAVNVDQAWRGFKLAEQFRKSKQNAMFLAVEAPQNRDDKVYWEDLVDLRDAMRKCNIRFPRGSWIALGHSGAYRTLKHWVDYKMVREMILLDALYSGDEEFGRFVETKGNKMILISTETSERSRSFIREYPYAVKRRKFPKTYEDLKRYEKSAKLLYIKAQFSHHGLVANQKVIPLMLRLTPLKLIKD